MVVIPDHNRGSIPLTIATFGKVTALVCKTNLRQQIAVLDFAVSEFESHLSHHMEVWLNGLQCRLVTPRGTGSNPVISAKMLG